VSAPEPHISVIIPVYNRADRVGAAVRSVVGADVEPVEIIVVDDGSTDGSGEAAEAALSALGPQAAGRVLRQGNGGAAAARNAGAAAARGAFLAFLDSDDLWLPWTLAALRDALRDHPRTEAIFFALAESAAPAGAAAIPREAALSRTYPNFLQAFLGEGAAGDPRIFLLGSGNLLIRRTTFEAIGGFDVALRTAEDQDLFLRLPLDAEVTCLIRPVMICYVTGHSDRLTRADAGLPALRRVLEKERAGLYPGGAFAVPDRRVFLARMRSYVIRGICDHGHYGRSLGLYLRWLPVLLRHRCKRFALRYPRHLAMALWREVNPGRG
jgi:glycosyltransferase involved in cell wall biosynthesis